jgi:epidermal growth factor receptor substrate 15
MLKPQMTGPLMSSPRQQVLDNDPFSVPFQPCKHDSHFTFCDQAHNSTASPDIFGDSHDASSLPLHDRSAEIGNVRNQLTSTEKSVSAAKEERQALEHALADQAVQLSSLQTQLSSAKASYETEMSLLSTLKDRRSAQLAEIQKTREELIRAESDLSAIRVEKAEIEGVFLRDKEEARELHRRMIDNGQQAEALKAEVEKLKKEAKQQRGLLAIARKQLSTKEVEKAKAETEHEEIVAEVMSLKEERISLDAEIASNISSPVPKPSMRSLRSSESLIFAASHPLPATPDLSQSVKSNNPFERLAKTSTSPTPRSQSPFVGLQNASVISSPSPSLANPVNGTSSPPLDVGAAPSLVMAERNPIATTEQLSLPALSSDIDLTFLKIGDAPERTASPSLNEHFVTPPTSAVRTATSDSTSSAAVKFPALDDMSAPFASAPKTSTPVLLNSFREETDLNSHLEELGDGDSDSDSEDESKVEDLGPAPTTNGNTDDVATSPVSEARDGTPTVKDSASPQPNLGPDTDANLFDEIFDTNASRPQPQPQGPAFDSSLFDTFTALADKPNSSLDEKPVEEPPRVAGVDEFDKTFDNISALSSSAKDPNDFFADSFGDNFDFDAAKVEFPTGAMGTTTQTQPQAASTFDNIFGSSNVIATPVLSAAPVLPQNKIDATFDDIFDSIDAGPSAAGIKPSEIAQPVVATSAASPVPSNEDTMPGAFPSQPVSPVISRTSAEREKSSPARVGSPKPRIKETSEKSKEPASHRHRLSVSNSTGLPNTQIQGSFFPLDQTTFP